MRSAQPGTSTFDAEVVGITPNGIWVLLDEEEHFLAFEEFPWFQDAPVRSVLNVERPMPHHLHWPAMDVDLHVESVRHPERYPLISHSHT